MDPDYFDVSSPPKYTSSLTSSTYIDAMVKAFYAVFEKDDCHKRKLATLITYLRLFGVEK